ncbi:zinc-binding dehydrogenase [Rothia kristinae]|uniref:zinc-binding dehydrogenase n=1 Tax=Rothia kristinae TaxID=37923 RepID=UPI000C25A304|nr:alcohol dehydrogenase catalytic domain-containing protein [Rothia kristinae]MCT1356486.1 alcohol dehydrogenase catalytic domain-containing protein [Rothia kristinae]MCT1392179.1 alcohol dehydrogenase catalytic domain-containing protein [Rothia kristinae]MCT1505054.1 alcohol dehydrogenase catalytic domain-containing protein [Rothia kristinae]MCT2037588.1 alcohol dehydrogenase catalytic domain-containing protein [Rothia kristinae]MCT2242583.1 alcohol dehydrogenase catalytic domain-containing 
MPTTEIPAQMQAVVCHGPENYTLETKPVPETGPTDLLIEVEAVGVCASDLKCYHGAPKFWGDENREQWAQEGITPGHEITGTIVRGSQEALELHSEGVPYTLQLGDRIVIEQIAPCGWCRYCQRGEYWMCGPHDMFGFREWDGAMAEYMLVPSLARVHRISRDVKPQHAAFAEPLSCALHAVERAQIKFEDTVVIAGAGPIGLSALIGARQKNPLRIITLDMDDAKLELARRCGADLTINIAEEDAVARIKELTDGYGADVYIECTGHPSAVPQGLNLLRKLGTYVEYSVFGSDVTVDWSIISDDKELNVYGAHLGPFTWGAAVKIIEEGELPLDDICTHQYPLDRFQEALDMVGDSRGASIKVSILPQSK